MYTRGKCRERERNWVKEDSVLDGRRGCTSRYSIIGRARGRRHDGAGVVMYFAREALDVRGRYVPKGGVVYARVGELYSAGGGKMGIPCDARVSEPAWKSITGWKIARDSFGEIGGPGLDTYSERGVSNGRVGMWCVRRINFWNLGAMIF